jgi:transcription elongation factor GreA
MTDAIEQKKQALLQDIMKLREEYQVELPKRIAEARSHGDLRENSEYDAARERQAFVKARIAQLSHALKQYNDVSAANTDEKTIGYGSVVVVLELNSNTRSEYTIVHPIEVDPCEGKISLASPVGTALQNRTVGEEVVITVPAGEKRLFIEKITSLHGNVFTA